jgi:hypothetical protein
MASISAFSRFSFRGTPKNGASILPNAVWNECKAKLHTDRRTYKKPKKNVKTHKNQRREP